MAFVNVPRFPDRLSYGSQGGPMWSTSVVVLQGGHEKRNALWTYPRHKYNARYAVIKHTDMEEIFEFFYSMRGRLTGFRFKDWHDYRSKTIDIDIGISSTDQVIGTGDGASTVFQLAKNYVIGTASMTRQIIKPVSATVTVAVGSATAAHTVNYNTGQVTFSVAPAVGSTITAGYEFDVPVRFDIDHLPVAFEDFEIRTADIPIIELRI